MQFRSILLFAGILFGIPLVIHANPDSTAFYKPKIEGTIRAKYEYNTSLDAHRFEVRNARFSVLGAFNKITSYKAEIDLSDEGVTKMLDAYLRIKPWSWVSLVIGQQKVPFSTDNLRSPHQLYFANRSFIGKQLTALRDVGATIEFVNKYKLPLVFSVGLYNGTGLYNQKVWRKPHELSYVGRLDINPAENWSISVDVNSIKPTNLRMNLFSVAFYTDQHNWHFESEYYQKIYQDSSCAPTHGFFAFLAYRINLANNRIIQSVAPVFRYDMMTKNIRFDDNGVMKIDQDRWRLTGGLTISLDKPFRNDIRINYEQYFYHTGVVNQDNKLVVEFVVKF